MYGDTNSPHQENLRGTNTSELREVSVKDSFIGQNKNGSYNLPKFPDTLNI